MDDNHIRTIIDTVLADTAESDPHALAEAVLARIPRRNYRAVLEAVLPQYVRIVATQRRASGTRLLVGAGSGRRAQVAEEITAAVAERADAIRSARMGIPTDDHEWRWITVGEMSVADLLAVAEHRRRLAKENLAAADKFDRAASVLLDSEGETLADLDDDQLVDLLG